LASTPNGYSVTYTNIKNYNIAGRIIPLRADNCGELLEAFGEEFNDKVEPVQQGYDDWGHAVRRITGGSGYSNHSSGTAMDLNAVQHGYGARNTFSPRQERAIHRLLKKYNHVIRWGGDYSGTKDEMHFEIDANYERVTRTLRQVRKRRVKTVNLHKLRPWKVNKQVLTLKRRMKSRGLLKRGAVHPLFGPNLRKDVARWQGNHGIKRPNGIPGPKMLKKLGFRVRR
jgi:hypothetical protein